MWVRQGGWIRDAVGRKGAELGAMTVDKENYQTLGCGSVTWISM